MEWLLDQYLCALERGGTRFSAEIGYWLGEQFWGYGIGTDVLRSYSNKIIEFFEVHRLFALIDPGNYASCRTCLKAGYRFEARLQDSIYKNNKFQDQLMYTLIGRSTKTTE
jgi:ribosomal-protein-alanine N-acetyltransferase